MNFLFTADRYLVVGDQTLIATLEVRAPAAACHVTITQAFAAMLHPATSHRASDPELVHHPNNAGLASTFVPHNSGSRTHPRSA